MHWDCRAWTGARAFNNSEPPWYGRVCPVAACGILHPDFNIKVSKISEHASTTRLCACSVSRVSKKRIEFRDLMARVFVIIRIEVIEITFYFSSAYLE